MSTSYSFATPLTTVDVLLFTVRDFWTTPGQHPRLEIALIKRQKEPFKDKLALPGTVMRIDPDLETHHIDMTDLDAAHRVLDTKLGVKAPHLEQLYTWFNRGVDPRGPTTVIAYFGVVPFDHFKEVDADRITFMPVDDLPKLAFNHNEIIEKGVERVHGKALYSTLPGLLLPKYFTIKEMQSIYEAVTGRKFDASNFQKLMLALNVVKEVDPTSKHAIETRARANRGQPGRPAKVFRLTVPNKLTTFEKTAF